MERQRDIEIERTKSRNKVCSFLISLINITHLFTGHRHYGTLFDRVRVEVRFETRTHVV